MMDEVHSHGRLAFLFGVRTCFFFLRRMDWETKYTLRCVLVGVAVEVCRYGLNFLCCDSR